MKRKAGLCALLTAESVVLLGACQACAPSDTAAPALCFQDLLSSQANGKRVEASGQADGQEKARSALEETAVLRLQDYPQDSVLYRIAVEEENEDYPDQITVSEWNAPQEGDLESLREADRISVQECGGQNYLVKLKKDRYYEVESVWTGAGGREERRAVYRIVTE